MARQPSHCWPSRTRSDQQGLEPRRAKLSAYPRRSSSSQTAALARRAAEATRPRDGPACRGESVKPRILVVEDNPLNRELLCDWLEVEGYEVCNAEDVTYATRISKGPPP